MAVWNDIIVNAVDKQCSTLSVQMNSPSEVEIEVEDRYGDNVLIVLSPEEAIRLFKESISMIQSWNDRTE